jgi:hypothetical protein
MNTFNHGVGGDVEEEGDGPGSFDPVGNVSPPLPSTSRTTPLTSALSSGLASDVGHSRQYFGFSIWFLTDFHCLIL